MKFLKIISFFKTGKKYLLGHISFTLKALLGSSLYIFSRNSPVIFLYHEITDDPNEFARDHELFISLENFEKQLIWILRKYEILNPSELLIDNKKENHVKSKPQAILTFDDGAKSIFLNAAPILRKYNVKALIFLNMEPILGKEFWAGKILYHYKYDPIFKETVDKKYQEYKVPFLRITQKDLDKYTSNDDKNINEKIKAYHGGFANLRDLMDNQDVFYYGSHLFNHYNATTLTKSELQEQLILNEEQMISIKGLPQLFAYPFGQPITCFDDKTDQIVLNSGVKKIFYANPGFISSLHNQKLNRISMNNHFNRGLIKFKISAIPFLKIVKSKFEKVLKI